MKRESNQMTEAQVIQRKKGKSKRYMTEREVNDDHKHDQKRKTQADEEKRKLNDTVCVIEILNNEHKA